jgi:hypothetical protein
MVRVRQIFWASAIEARARSKYLIAVGNEVFERTSFQLRRVFRHGSVDRPIIACRAATGTSPCFKSGRVSSRRYWNTFLPIARLPNAWR